MAWKPQCASLTRPVSSFSKLYEMNPNAIPSVMLTVSGGLVGLLAGAGAALAVRSLSSRPIELAWESGVLALALSVLVGLVFGLLPARRAAGLHPVDALR